MVTPFLVRAHLGDGKGRFGTAFAVSSHHFLTAHHVVCDASKVEVKIGDEWRPAEHKWQSAELDASLILVPALNAKPAVLGRYDRSCAVEWSGAGFPGAAKVELDQGSLRVSAGVRGVIEPQGGREINRLELVIEAGPRSVDDWKGLSGAPVEVDGRVVGIVTEGPQAFEGRRLWATPIRALLEDSDFVAHVRAPEVPVVPGSVLRPRVEVLSSTNPASLLNARYRVVPFDEQLRGQELTSIAEWCDSLDPFGLRLWYGRGGSGKTRLFIEATRRQRETGWQAGFLSEARSLEDLDGILGNPRPALVVIDYAEKHPRLRNVVGRLLERPQVAPIRVALLSRHAGDWWASLLKSSDVLRDRVEASRGQGAAMLRAATSGGEDERARLFGAAFDAFSKHLDRHDDAPQTPPLTDKRFERPLYIHMAALAALEGDDVVPKDLIQRVLDREELHWVQNLLVAGTDEADDAVRPAARRVMAALTLRGGAETEEELCGTIEASQGELPQDCRVPGTFRVRLRRMFPGDGSPGASDAYVSGLEPDLLGDTLIARVLQELPDPKGFVERIVGSTTRWTHVFGRLGQIMSTNKLDAPLETLIAGLLAGDVSRAESAWKASLSLAEGQEGHRTSLGRVLAEHLRMRGAVTPEDGTLAARIASEVPKDTVALRELALWGLERLVLSASRADEKRAAILNEFGARLDDLGRHEDAIEAENEAFDIYRKLAANRPGAFLPDLAMSLSRLSATHHALGHHEDAFNAAKEAVDIYQKLVANRPDAFLPELAVNLNNLGVTLRALSRNEDALNATKKAVDIYQKLVANRPDALLPGLARSVNNLGNALWALGRHEEALVATNAAVDIWKKLAANRPDAFLPDLAMSLNNVSNLLRELGRYEDAIKAAKGAVDVYRELTITHPDAFLPGLASSLVNLGAALCDPGRHEALEPASEAVEIYRKLAITHPDAFLPGLAMSLNNLGNVLHRLNRHEDAFEATNAAVDIRKKLAAERPEAFLPDLAMSLGNLGAVLCELGHYEDALQAANASVEIRKKLAAKRPEAFLPGLATSLTNLGATLHEFGRHEDALEATSAAVESYRKLASARPEAFLPRLAMSLNNLAVILSEVGRSEGALAATQEVDKIAQTLANGEAARLRRRPG